MSFGGMRIIDIVLRNIVLLLRMQKTIVIASDEIVFSMHQGIRSK